MNWIEVITIIGTLGGMMYWMKTDLKENIQALDVDVKQNKASLDGWSKHITAMQAEQSKRIDQTNHRIDDTYKIILKMLEDKK